MPPNLLCVYNFIRHTNFYSLSDIERYNLIMPPYGGATPPDSSSLHDTDTAATTVTAAFTVKMFF